MLTRAGEAAKAEWLLNFTRQKVQLDDDEAQQLPFGTTTNEALHAELNRWFRGLVRLHRPVLRLKLRILRMLELMTHNAAAYRPTTVQMAQSTVAHRVVRATDPWTAQQWRNWCAVSTGSTSASVARAGLQQEVSKWRAGKGLKTGMKRRQASKRSVFTSHKGLSVLKRMKAMKK